MSTPIHSWKYIQDRKYTTKIELYYNHILEYRAGSGPIIHTFDNFLGSKTVLANLIVDYEIIEYLMTISILQEYNPDNQLVYRFYNGFKNKHIPESIYEYRPQKDSSAKHFRSLNKYGIEQYRETEEGIFIEKRQRFNTFLIEGPWTSNLPYDLRKNWRFLVWNALKDPKVYTLMEAFPLFDYHKITVKHYENRDENGVGSFIEIQQGYICIGNWICPEDPPYVKEYSIEQIWYDERLIPSTLKAFLPDIHANLLGAIVEGHRYRRYRQLIESEKAGQPREAPPA